MADTTDEAGIQTGEDLETESQIEAGTPQPLAENPAAEEPEEQPIDQKPYQQLMLQRWRTIESMLAQSWAGLRNAGDKLSKLTDRREFNEQHFAMTGALLTLTERIHRAHNGFEDAPPEPETSLYVPPEKKIEIAR